MGGTFQQNGTLLHRAVGQDPVGDAGRAHKQGDVREGSPLWQGEDHLTALEVGDSLQLNFMTSCQGRPILGHGRSGSGACYARSLLWDFQLVSLILGSPFPITKERKVLSHKGFFAVPLQAFGNLGTGSIKYSSLNLLYGYVEGESLCFIKVIQSGALSVQKGIIRRKWLNRNPQRHKPGAQEITEATTKTSSTTNWWAIKKLQAELWRAPAWAL